MASSHKKKITARREPRFELIAGSLCLDFINTLDDRFSSEPKELLKDYVDLARFAEDTGILDPTQADHLFELSMKSPEAARRALRAAIQLREAIFAVIWAVVTKKIVPAGAFITLNEFVQMAAQHSSLVQSSLVPSNVVQRNPARQGEKFEWRFDTAPNSFEAPLWPIARSAADLLASDELQFVRACASETCQWLFLDVSKNHRRRWCDMTKCGNRAKVRAFYSRAKKGG